jgi:hypothetical protein
MEEVKIFRSELEDLGFIFNDHLISYNFYKDNKYDDWLIEIIKDDGTICVKRWIDDVLSSHVSFLTIETFDELRLILKMMGLK